MPDREHTDRPDDGLPHCVECKDDKLCFTHARIVARALGQLDTSFRQAEKARRFLPTRTDEREESE